MKMRTWLILEKMRIYRDYQRAFKAATGLPLQIRSALGAGRVLHAGDNLAAFLDTGRVLFNPPGRTGFNKITAQLIKWGTRADLKRTDFARIGHQQSSL